MTYRRYTVLNSVGDRYRLDFVNWREGKAHLVSPGAASYLADPDTGLVEGVESREGIRHP